MPLTLWRVTQKLSSYPMPDTVLIELPSCLRTLKSKDVPPTFINSPVGIDSEFVTVILSAFNIISWSYRFVCPEP